MKKIIFAFIFVFTQNLVAQPTITQGQFPLAVGDIITTYDQAYSIPSEGANQTWNYTALDLSTPATVNIISPGSSVIVGLPTSTLCITSLPEECFFIDAVGMQRTGLGGTAISAPYDNGEFLFHFPIGFGDSAIDTFHAHLDLQGTLGSRNGTVTIDVAGYGTLQLPNSVTINNALLVKTHELILDSVEDGVGWDLFNYDFTTYNFYAANYHGSILLITTGTTPDGPMVLEKYNILASGSGIELHNISGNLAIYPNPVEEQLKLTNNGNIDITGFNYDIINMQGEKIKTGVINRDHLSFDVSGLNAGLYIFNIYGNQFNASKRFMKQ